MSIMLYRKKGCTKQPYDCSTKYPCVSKYLEQQFAPSGSYKASVQGKEVFGYLTSKDYATSFSTAVMTAFLFFVYDIPPTTLPTLFLQEGGGGGGGKKYTLNRLNDWIYVIDLRPTPVSPAPYPDHLGTYFPSTIGTPMHMYDKIEVTPTPAKVLEYGYNAYRDCALLGQPTKYIPLFSN